ncbi:peptidylprolyl isomerase [Romboutsia sp.]|uniref:peptidylprolyl isomerase n=1 Tax=Romboutsia sp. TaxID=1965302 RepID=UPI003F408A0F
MKNKKIMALVMTMLLGISTVACSGGSKSDEVVATINGKEITSGQFKTTLSLYKTSIESMYGKDIWETEVEKGVKYKDKFKESMIEQMVSIQAVYEDAKKKDLLPSKEDVEKNVKELKKSLYADETSKKKFEEIGVNDQFLKEQEEQDLAIQNHKANFEKATTISDTELKKYYEDNKKSFYKDEVKASHILISTLDANNKPLSETKKKEAKKKAEDILKRAKGGEEFSALAKEFSDDKGSGSQGGDLDYFGKGEMVKPFEDAAFSMKVGDISALVESEYGYHIIKLTDKVQGQTSFEDAKETIKSALLAEKYKEETQKLYKNMKVEKNEDIIKKITF